MKKIENYLISIIVPVYNSQTTINKCIDSLINQTYKNIEIILINDGSKDNSLNICKYYKKIDERIIVIDQINQGVSSARNKGIDICNGEFIIFVDSDDFIEVDTITELVKILNTENKYDLIIFGINRVNKAYKKLNKYIHTDIVERCNSIIEISELLPKLITSEKINSPVNKLYKSNIIKDSNIKFNVNLNIAEDLMFNIEYIMHVRSIYVTNKPFYNYSIDDECTLSKSYNKDKYKQLIQVNNNIGNILSIFDQNDIEDAVKYIRIKNLTSCFIDLHSKEHGLSIRGQLEYIQYILNHEKKEIKYIQKLTILNKINILSLIYRYSNKYIVYAVSIIIYSILTIKEDLTSIYKHVIK